ncbi:16405_t:CDS:2, partial [Racocetra fulgida]
VNSNHLYIVALHKRKSDVLLLQKLAVAKVCCFIMIAAVFNPAQKINEINDIHKLNKKYGNTDDLYTQTKSKQLTRVKKIITYNKYQGNNTIGKVIDKPVRDIGKRSDGCFYNPGLITL